MPLFKQNLFLLHFFYICAIFLFTFPAFSPDFSPGLDPSYAWALNHLFDAHYAQLTQLLFPLGPLGFLRFTTTEGNNLLWTMLFYSAVKITFLSLFFRLAYQRFSSTTTAFLLTLLLAAVAGLDLLLMGLCITLLTHSESIPYKYFIAACLVAILAFFIKASIGLSCLSMLITALLYHSFQYRNGQALLLRLSLFMGLFLCLGLLVFGSLPLLVHFTSGTLHLVSGYTDALLLSPSNNWWLLGSGLLLIVLFPFLQPDKQTLRFYVLMSLPLFMSWKHAMSREDLPHSGVFFYFLFLFWGLLIAGKRFRSPALYFFPPLCIALYFLHLATLAGFNGIAINLSGLSHFNRSVLHYNAFKAQHEKLSQQAIARKKLDPKTRALIGDASVDVYPWELSYIPANDLHWKPRTMLQSGAFTDWYDRMDASSFTREAGPEFLLVEPMGGPNGVLSSLDGRYLLNDEPLTMRNLLKNYRLIQRSDTLLLFQKSTTPRLGTTDLIQSNTVSWNRWIDVPENGQDLLSVDVQSSYNLKGRLKSLLYKGEEYYIDYLLADSAILSYRYVPSNARQGVWISPLITRFQPGYPEKVCKIRFRVSNPKMVDPTLSLTWKKTKCLSDSGSGTSSAWQLFNLQAPEAAMVLRNVHEDFEEEHHSATRHPDSVFTGRKALLADTNSFRMLYELPVDSIKGSLTTDALVLSTGLNYRTSAKDSIQFVVTIEQSKNDRWLSQSLMDVFESSVWLQASLQQAFSRSRCSGAVLKVFVWNQSKTHKAAIDHFYVHVTAQPSNTAQK